NATAAFWSYLPSTKRTWRVRRGEAAAYCFTAAWATCSLYWMFYCESGPAEAGSWTARLLLLQADRRPAQWAPWARLSALCRVVPLRERAGRGGLVAAAAPPAAGGQKAGTEGSTGQAQCLTSGGLR